MVEDNMVYVYNFDMNQIRVCETVGDRIPRFYNFVILSDELNESLGFEKGAMVTYGDVERMINEYIDSNSLRDEANPNRIRPNEELRKIFNITENDSSIFFVMKSIVKHHIIDSLYHLGLSGFPTMPGPLQRLQHEPILLSDELYEFLSLPKGIKVPREDVTRMIDEYITTKGLRDETDPRKIRPNNELHKIFNSTDDDDVTYFNLKSYMKHHYIKENRDNKLTLLSDKLYEFLNIEKGTAVARKDVKRMICEYIKTKGLRDETDHRVIRPNNELHKILNSFNSTENDEIANTCIYSSLDIFTYIFRHHFIPINEFDTYCCVSKELYEILNIRYDIRYAKKQFCMVTRNIVAQIVKENLNEFHKILNITENRISYFKIQKSIKHHFIECYFKTTILSAELYEFLNIEKGTWLSRQLVVWMIRKYIENNSLYDPAKKCIMYYSIGYYVIKPNKELHKIFNSTENDNINYMNMVSLIEHHFYDGTDFECARFIQRHWKTCISDPNYAICRRRLRYEFEGLSSNCDSNRHI